MPSTRRRLLEVAALALPGVALQSTLARAAGVMTRAPRKRRILILGGTGFIGPHEVRYALARGHQVTIFNRGRQPREWPGEVEELIGDRNTGDLTALAGREWDICIDNPTTLPFWVRDAGQMLKGKVKRYVFISTISVYAANNRSADETAKLAAYEGPDPMAETADTLKAKPQLYGPLKAASEREAKRQFPRTATIIRPGLISGPGDDTDRFTYWPVRLARGGEVLAPGTGADPAQFIDARDLAEWTVRMAESGQPGVYNATGPARPIDMRRFLAGVATGVHAEPTLTWVPAAFLEAQNVGPWTDLPVWVPAQGDTAGFARRDIGRALRAGLTFRPIATTAADTLAWSRTRPAERQANPKAGLSADREAAVLAAWKGRPAP